MAKMYYTEAEAAEKLGATAEALKALVAEGKLRVYADGPRKMYKVEEVDALAAARPGESGEIELAPADTGTQDALSLAEADTEKPPGAKKEDTVITSEGISIFDEEDLEVEAADPMAKTSIAPSLEDQISIDGVGSGSGLLDLTRESDDTSLGAEVLDQIDMESAVGSSAAVEAVAEETSYVEPAPAVPEVQAVAEEVDGASGAFSGLILAGCLLMLLLGAVGLAAMMGLTPPYAAALYENLPVFLGAAVVLALLLAAGGYFLGKSAADRAAAMRRAGGS